MYIVNNSFTNMYGQTFHNVNQLEIGDKKNLPSLGKIVCESHNDSKEYEDVIVGVYIYQDNNDKSKAYRIYKSFVEPDFNGFFDDGLIENLLERKACTNYCDFPTGVVTLKGKIIGQQIPFHKNAKTLDTLTKEKENISDVLNAYKQVLQIIRDLYLNKVIYFDIHSNNFMMNMSDKSVKIIDFDSYFIRFDIKHNDYLKQILSKYNNMVNGTLEEYKIYDLARMPMTSSFDETGEHLENVMNKSLVLKNR